MRKAPIKITAIIVVLSMVFVGVFMSTDQDDINIMLTAFTNNTQNLNKNLSFSQTVKEIDQKSDSNTTLAGLGSSTGDPSLPDIPTGPAPTGWIDILRAYHKLFHDYIGKYIYGGRGDIIEFDGHTETVRPDCSGYIGYCLYKQGILTRQEASSYTSGAGSSGGTHDGVTCFPAQDVPYDQWQIGDILFYSGHVEALAEQLPADISTSYKPKVYNWGGDYSAGHEYESIGGYTLADVTYIWRLN